MASNLQSKHINLAKSCTFSKDKHKVNNSFFPDGFACPLKNSPENYVPKPAKIQYKLQAIQ